MNKISANLSLKSLDKYIILAGIILVLGIYFRVTNLNSKIYWVDEVATSLRVAGFTKQELIQEVSSLGQIPIKDLQNYQKISDRKSFDDTIQAFIKSPEHAPLYFILARVWTKFWGSSVTAIRSLSVLFSLLTLPLIYWLGRLIFQSSKTGWFAVCLLAVSPLYVTYAQEARPYSLWVGIILLSQIALFRALRSNYWLNWLVYTISLILSFYTSLLSVLVIISQSFYVILINGFRVKSKVIYQLTAVAIALVAFSPWLVIIAQNWQQLQDNTTWMKVPLNPIAMIVIWIYSLATIFIETPIYPQLDLMILMRILIDVHLFALIFFSFYFLYKNQNQDIWLFILLQIFAPLMIMRGSDLILGNQMSTAIRYMMPSYLLIHLTVAYLLASKIPRISQHKKLWIIIFSLVLFIEISSCVFMLDRSPRYQKTRNFNNPEIARIINLNSPSILLTEPSHILDAVSLSYLLNPSTQFQLAFNPSSWQILSSEKTIYFLNPSSSTINQITMEKVYQPKLLTDGEIHLSLWKLKN